MIQVERELLSGYGGVELLRGSISAREGGGSGVLRRRRIDYMQLTSITLEKF